MLQKQKFIKRVTWIENKLSDRSAFIKLHWFSLSSLIILLSYGTIHSSVTFTRDTMLVKDLHLVTQEFRYYMPKASEVFLVWGIDGWQPVAKKIQSPETEIKGKVMHTLMDCKSDTFYIKVQVPSCATLDYGFLVTELKEGVSIKETWQGDYHATPPEDGIIEKSSYLKSIVTQQICYHFPSAEEVDLAWRINSWQVISEVMCPPGTFVEDNIMHTPMIQKDDFFCTKIKVLKGTTIDYGFMVKTIENGFHKKLVWDRGYHFVASQDSLIHIKPNMGKKREKYIFKALKLGLILLAGIIIVSGICVIILCFIPFPLKMKKALLIIMINGVAFVATVFTGEMYFRLRGFQTYVRTFSNQCPNNSVGTYWAQVDTYLGWVGRKDYPDINPQGFRDPKDFDKIVHNFKKNRVMIVGDSFMWGAGVRVHENVPGLLQTRFQDKYDFYNISVGGWGIDQMYMAYQKYKDIIKPNIVILAYIDNDINRVLECYRQTDNLTKPGFTIQADTLDKGATGSPWQLFLNNIQRESVLFSMIMQLYYLRKEAIPITKKIFSNLIVETKKRNEEFFIVRIPTSEYSLYSYFNQKLYDLKDAVSDSEVKYLEPFDEITKIPNWTLDLYLYDGHMSVEGNQFLADYIYRNIFEKSD